jgi:ubiquinone/menaquinone biosynthesis C-methylase UbiE
VASPSRDIRRYYEARAPEYDDWYLGHRLFSDELRPGFDEEVTELINTLSGLPPARTVDVACGTGFLTQHLHGDVVGLDASASMLAIAQSRIPSARFVQADGLTLPLRDQSFDRLVAGHFYCHLLPAERARFVAEARRVAAELVFFEQRLRDDVDAAAYQPRELSDGTAYEIYKRYFTGRQLTEELGGADILHEGVWFVCVRALAS